MTFGYIRHLLAIISIRAKTRLYHLVKTVGRWSMLDPFVIAIFVPVMRYNSVITARADGAATAFAAVVISTMIAATPRGWYTEVFVRNLLDKAAWTQLLPGTFESGTVYGYLNEPRFFGATIGRHW